ncbi:unnamed protein product [Schistocephalus solidus]|uniref:Uncharacterized protein n=1 Tax=Schistocephalus solidus TaxID=70667 RepID=A0A183SB38_SCHSO|nr:unnamed protein product [Schistocephalus solidus]
MMSSDEAKNKFYEDLHAEGRPHGEACWAPTVSVAVTKTAHFCCEPCETPSSADQHLLPPSDVGEGYVDASSIAGLAAAGPCSLLEARSTGHAGDQVDPQCQRMDGSPPHPFQDEVLTSTPTKDSLCDLSLGISRSDKRRVLEGCQLIIKLRPHSQSNVCYVEWLIGGLRFGLRWLRLIVTSDYLTQVRCEPFNPL